jgi:predicted SAM-dependent methyltransferase
MDEELIDGRRQDRLYLGCGLNPVPGWENVDKSFGPAMARFPSTKKILHRIGVLNDRQAKVTWSSEPIHRVDVSRHWPWAPESLDYIFCDRMVRFFTPTQFTPILRNCYRSLRPRGEMRITAHDAEEQVRRYLSKVENHDPKAADWLNWAIEYGHEPTGRLINQTVRRLFPRLEHGSIWLWDYGSLAAALESVGFASVKRHQPKEGVFPDLQALEDNVPPGELVVQVAKP